MKHFHPIKLMMLLLSVTFISCNNMNSTGSNTTDEGTTTTNDVNAEMENNRTTSGTDTIASPGSNSMDLKDNTNISNKGTGNTTGNETLPSTSTSATDKNMQGQSSTHGKDTKSGAN